MIIRSQDKERISIINNNDSIGCRSRTIYSYNGVNETRVELGEYSTKEKAIIYRWLPVCKSEDCTSLGLTQSYCDEKGIELYVITDSYTEAFTQIDSIKNPMFSIDIAKFRIEPKDFDDDLFYKELLGDKYDKKNYDRFYYFENGEFIRTYKNIVEVTKN